MQPFIWAQVLDNFCRILSPTGFAHLQLHLRAFAEFQPFGVEETKLTAHLMTGTKTILYRTAK